MTEVPITSGLVRSQEYWDRLSPDEQDALIASGWHPGPLPSEKQIRAEREAQALRELLSEAVEWARRPSPIPIVPFQEFLDRAAAACGRVSSSKARREWLDRIGEGK